MTPTVGGPINESFFEIYDATVQIALQQPNKPHVIVDVVSRVRFLSSAAFPQNVYSTTMLAGMDKSSIRVDLPTPNLPACGLNLPPSMQTPQTSS